MQQIFNIISRKSVEWLWVNSMVQIRKRPFRQSNWKGLFALKTQCSFNNLLGFCVRQVKVTPAKFLGKFWRFASRKIVHLGIDDDRSDSISLYRKRESLDLLFEIFHWNFFSIRVKGSLQADIASSVGDQNKHNLRNTFRTGLLGGFPSEIEC